MEGKVYKTRGFEILIKRIIITVVIGILACIFAGAGIGARSPSARLFFLLSACAALLYLWYLKKTLTDVTLTIHNNGITYDGFIFKGPFVRESHVDVPWNMITAVRTADYLKVFKQQIDPIRIVTSKGIPFFGTLLIRDER